eukprot:superscaffoldBa00002787_g15282
METTAAQGEAPLLLEWITLDNKRPLNVAGSQSRGGDLPRYDFVEIEDPTEKTILGRWCGSQSVPTTHISKGSQIRIRFISDEYFPSEPGFCIHYSLLPV